MFVLTYYDEKDSLIRILERPFYRQQEAQEAMKHAVLQQLKKNNCPHAEELYKQAETETGYCLDEKNEIELEVEPFVAYIHSDFYQPYFATYQIVQIDDKFMPKLEENSRAENKKMERILEIFEPLLTIMDTTDVLFSPKVGYVVLSVLTQKPEIWESKIINDPRQMAEELLESVQSDYCYLLGIGSLLPISVSGTIEEYEYIMPHVVKAQYMAIVKKMRTTVRQVLRDDDSFQPDDFFKRRHLVKALYSLVSYIRSQQGLYRIKNMGAYYAHIETILQAYGKTFRSVYLGKLPQKQANQEIYQEYTGSELVQYYDFCIPHKDGELLKLIEQWEYLPSDQSVKLYYQIVERIINQGGIWFSWKE